jgi:hypothetical protein
MAKRTNKSPMDTRRLETLQQLNLSAAGLDIGAEEIYACVPADPPRGSFVQSSSSRRPIGGSEVSYVCLPLVLENAGS